MSSWASLARRGSGVRGRLATLGCAAFVLAACGGGQAATTTATSASSEQWAGSVCAAGTTYEQALTSAASAFAKNPSKAGINQALSQAKQATDNLKTTLKGLGKPGTPAGQAARSQVNDLVTTISGDLQTIQHAVTNGSALQATTTVAATVPAIRTSITQTIDKLKKLNGSELKASFAAAPACATFKSSGGS